MTKTTLLWRFIACVALLAGTPASADSLIVKTGWLIDPVAETVTAGQCITIDDDRVSLVGQCPDPLFGPQVIDWSSKYVLPGLIDLHTHLADSGQSADLAAPVNTSPAATALIGAANARTTLMAGFTTVRDVGTYRGLTDVALRDAINTGLVPGPRMFVAGAYITIPKGGGELNGVMPNEQLPADMRLGVAATPKEAEERAAALLGGGADFLKLIATGAVLAIGTEPGQPELTEAQMRAAVELAKARGTYATAHAHGAEGIQAAIRAGVRSIEHASLIDDATLKMAKDAGTWLVMDIFNGDYIDDIGRKEGWPEEYLRKNRETTDVQREGFAKAVKMGVNLAFGSDSGVYPHGINARQFAYMVRYGMTPIRAIRSATSDAAIVIGKPDTIGRIAPGFFADMIAVDANPLADVRALETVAHVIKDGVLVK